MKIHTSLPVRNIKATSAFYSILFDSEPTKTKADYAKFEPETLALNISFHKSEKNELINTHLHLGIQYPSQEALNIAYQRLSQAKLISQEKETSICCYANQEKFWVQDPSGYQWELYYLVEDSTIKIEETSGCCIGQEVSCNDSEHKTSDKKEKSACC